MLFRRRTCRVCKKSLPLHRFETEGLTKSKLCRSRDREKRFTKSHIRYLKNLFGQLKSNRTKQGMTWNITPEDIYELWYIQDGLCNLSGEVLTFSRGRKNIGGLETNASIDRINPNKGYIKNNIQLVTKRVNLMKHTLTQDEFLSIIKAIYGKKIQKS